MEQSGSVPAKSITNFYSGLIKAAKLSIVGQLNNAVTVQMKLDVVRNIL